MEPGLPPLPGLHPRKSGCNPLPPRCRHDKQLVSHDVHTSSYNYKYTFSVEVAPLCKVGGKGRCHCPANVLHHVAGAAASMHRDEGSLCAACLVCLLNILGLHVLPPHAWPAL